MKYDPIKKFLIKKNRTKLKMLTLSKINSKFFYVSIFQISSIKSTNCCDNYILETFSLSSTLYPALFNTMLHLCGSKKNTQFTVISFRNAFHSICDKFAIRTLITEHAAHKAKVYKTHNKCMRRCLHHGVEVSLHKILLPKRI